MLALFAALVALSIYGITFLHIDTEFIERLDEDNRIRIDQRYYLVNEYDKLAAMTRLFEMEDIHSALIFTKTRVGSDELAGQLSGRV